MKKKIIIISILILSIIATLGYMFLSSDDIKLTKKEYTFEYGKEINLNKENLLKTKDEKVINSIDLDLSEIDLEENQTYPKVGEYLVDISFENFFIEKEKEIKVKVVDSAKPEITSKKDQFIIKEGSEDYDFKSSFTVEDLSETTLTIHTKEVNFEKAGTYQAQAKATDIHNNKSVFDFKVIVEEKKEVVQPDKGDNDNNQEGDDSQENKVEATIVNGIIIANKKHPLPATYNPGEDKEAGQQIRKLISDMQSMGFDISDNYSGFRSYSYQKQLYNNYVKRDGKKAADTYSARPGHSEHQLGLTFDLKHSNGSLVTKEKEAKWIANNAYKYGFIVRYQQGKEHITGYQAEPWHLRYINKEVAEEIYNANITLEEYLNVEGGDYISN